jgi:hypothetical protein
VKQSRALVPMASALVFILRGAVMHHGCVLARCCNTLAYWPAFALRGRPLSAALSSSASAARGTGFQALEVKENSVFEPPQ